MLPPEPPPPYAPAPSAAGPGYGVPPGPAAPHPGGIPEPAGIGYAQPGYPQVGYAQPGYAPPGTGSGYPQPAGYGQPHPADRNAVRIADPALAEWWRRLLARLIDGVVLTVVLGLILAPLWVAPWTTFLHRARIIFNEYPAGHGTTALTNALGNAEAHFVTHLLPVFLLFYLGAFFYDWIQHALWGQTIGKRALGTQVVTAHGRAKIGPAAACGRAAVYALVPVVPLVGGLFGLINELWLTWDPRRQCLHDKAAHTVVIKKNFQSSPPQAGSW